MAAEVNKATATRQQQQLEAILHHLISHSSSLAPTIIKALILVKVVKAATTTTTAMIPMALVEVEATTLAAIRITTVALVVTAAAITQEVDVTKGKPQVRRETSRCSRTRPAIRRTMRVPPNSTSSRCREPRIRPPTLKVEQLPALQWRTTPPTMLSTMEYSNRPRVQRFTDRLRPQ